MSHLFETLTPDVMLAALEATGLLLDGRLMTLSSYENRVVMAHTEDGAAVVAKFYRPQRWSDAQIQEEHDFAAQLAEAEIPLAAPMVFNGQTLHHAQGFRYSISPRKGGRTPELDDLDTLEWIGRFLARMHTVGATAPFAVRPALNVASFGTEPYDWLVQHASVAPEVSTAWRGACQEALALVAACAGRTLAGTLRPQLHLLLHRPRRLKASSTSVCMATATPAIFCGPPKAAPPRPLARTL
jgi:Ser/Thr protein kinase RdoA (MazF antagonist)